MQQLDQSPIIIYTDSDNIYTLAYSVGFKPATKWLDLHYHIIKERIELGKIKLVLIDSEDNVADGLTKALDTTKFKAFRKRLWMVDA